MKPLLFSSARRGELAAAELSGSPVFSALSGSRSRPPTSVGLNGLHAAISQAHWGINLGPPSWLQSLARGRFTN